MDPLTHMALGAAVGEATLGGSIGNRALLYGAVIGALPDLDLLPSIFMDFLVRLQYHRGFTHSILFALIFSPALGYIIFRMHRGGEIRHLRFLLLPLMALATHIVLDCFTAYGTRIFSPVSQYRVALSSISVVDPLFSLPLALLVMAVIVARKRGLRHHFAQLALIFCSAYLVLTVVSKGVVSSVFLRSIECRGIPYSRIYTAPTFFNNFLWIGIAEGKDHYFTAYYSHFDGSGIQFKIVAKNHRLLTGITGRSEIQELISFSRGFYAVEEGRGYLVFNDLRYGELETGRDAPQYNFSYRISLSGNDVSIERNSKARDRLKYMSFLLRRMMGKGEMI